MVISPKCKFGRLPIFLYWVAVKTIKKTTQDNELKMNRLTTIRNINRTVDHASALKQIGYMIRCCDRTETDL